MSRKVTYSGKGGGGVSKERFRRYILACWGTQAAFAKFIGWSRQRLSRFIASDASPKISRVNFLAHAMGVSVREVIELLDE